MREITKIINKYGFKLLFINDKECRIEIDKGIYSSIYNPYTESIEELDLNLIRVQKLIDIRKKYNKDYTYILNNYKSPQEVVEFRDKIEAEFNIPQSQFLNILH